MRLYLLSVGALVATLWHNAPDPVPRVDASGCHIAPIVVRGHSSHYNRGIHHNNYGYGHAVFGNYGYAAQLYSNIIVGHTPELPPELKEKLLKQREEILNLREEQFKMKEELHLIKTGAKKVDPWPKGLPTPDPLPKEDGTIPAPVKRADMHPGLVVQHDACFKCHNDKEQKGDVNLFPKGVPTTDPKVIQKSVEMVHERKMPPPKERKLTGDERYDFLSYYAIKEAKSEPGTTPAP